VCVCVHMLVHVRGVMDVGVGMGVKGYDESNDNRHYHKYQLPIIPMCK